MSDLTEEDHKFLDYWVEVEEDLLRDAFENKRMQQAAAAVQTTMPVLTSTFTAVASSPSKKSSTIIYSSKPIKGVQTTLVDPISGQIIKRPTMVSSTFPLEIPSFQSFFNSPMPLPKPNNSLLMANSFHCNNQDSLPLMMSEFYAQEVNKHLPATSNPTQSSFSNQSIILPISSPNLGLSMPNINSTLPSGFLGSHASLVSSSYELIVTNEGHQAPLDAQDSEECESNSEDHSKISEQSDLSVSSTSTSHFSLASPSLITSNEATSHKEFDNKDTLVTNDPAIPASLRRSVRSNVGKKKQNPKSNSTENKPNIKKNTIAAVNIPFASTTASSLSVTTFTTSDEDVVAVTSDEDYRKELKRLKEREKRNQKLQQETPEQREQRLIKRREAEKRKKESWSEDKLKEWKQKKRNDRKRYAEKKRNKKCSLYSD